MIHPTVESLRDECQAQALGLWRMESRTLVLVAFASCEELTEEVSRAFRQATSRVSLEQTGLGIVQAALNGNVQISIANELPATEGSGLWLRRFGADLSIAVPIQQGDRLLGVVSVALVDSERNRNEVVVSLQGWGISPQGLRSLDADL